MKLDSFWTIQIFGWLIYLVMIYVTFLTIAPEGASVRLFEIKLVRTIVGFLLTCAMRQIYRRFDAKYSIYSIVVLVLGCSLIVGAAWTGIENYYSSLRNVNFDWATAFSRSPRNALDYGLTLTAWSALYFGVTSWLAWQRERDHALEFAALANQAQLETLRYQLNPHFLFNSLNSLRASIDENPARARQMVTQLAEFLRYSLVHHNSQKITLGAEIEAARNYLAIEQIRFEDKLSIEWDIERAAEDFPVPCFLLNPLIENAVKHGFSDSSRKLKVRISARIDEKNLFLEVANTGKINLNGDGSKIGLINVRERLAKMFPANSDFVLSEENGWVCARMRIGF